MLNFLDETVEFIENNRLLVKNIIYIGSPDGYAVDWPLFRLLANHNYENISDFPVVVKDLKIIFRNLCVLERFEHKKKDSDTKEHLSSWSLGMIEFIPERKKRLINIFVIDPTRPYTAAEINF